MEQSLTSSRFARLGLRGRLLIVSALASVPLFAALIHYAFEQRSAATREVEVEALRLARLLSDQHQRLVHKTQDVLTLLSKQEKITPPNRTACGALMTRFVAINPEYANMGIIDDDGNVVCSATDLDTHLNLADLPPVRDALSNRRSERSDFLTTAIAPTPTLIFAQPVVDHAGQVRGALFAALSVTWTSRFLANLHAPGETALTVVDRELRVLTTTQDNVFQSGVTLAGTPLGIAIAGAGGGPYATKVGPIDDDRLYGIDTLLGADGTTVGYIAVGLPTHGELALTQASTQRNLAISAALFLIMLLTAWWAGGAFVLKHVRALIIAFRKLEAGDFSARLPDSDSSSELSQLSRAYNRVVTALNERQQQIQHHAQEIATLNRIHAVASSSSAAVLRIQDRQRLLEEICRIAVEAGQFRVAFVAEADTDTHRCHAVAWYGVSESEMRLLFDRMNQKTSEHAATPAMIALFDNRYAIATDLQLEPASVAAWCRDHRIGAWASFPLAVRGRCVGSLNLCAETPHFFDHEELRLLQTVAADASFGLEFVEKERQRNYLAYYDPLTDLPNRMLFLDRLEREVHHARAAERSLAVLVLGLRGFRRINDTLGRHVGDTLLSQAAQQLRTMAHDFDTFARVGHDEFGAILIEAGNPAQVGDRANRLLLAAPKYFRVDSHDVYVDWNGGVALYPNNGTDAHALVKSAETASHSAARIDGSALLFYTPDMDQQARQRFEIEARLRDAIRRDELALHYQPVVDVHSGKAMSIEALLRWNNPELGMQSAANFIPIAEETGLILPLGDWVIAHACRQLCAWRTAGQRVVPVALNLSAKQLQQADFADRLIGAIKAGGCDPKDVPFAVEITESELMRNVKSAADVLLQLKHAGLSIYVDDFGTGYSSLSYLQQLPIDVLKIDRSFIQDLAPNPRTRAMVNAVITMAHNLGLRVIAEGVENHAELAILRDMGCDAVQGYLFSVPGAANDIEPLLNRNLLLA